MRRRRQQEFEKEAWVLEDKAAVPLDHGNRNGFDDKDLEKHGTKSAPGSLPRKGARWKGPGAAPTGSRGSHGGSCGLVSSRALRGGVATDPSENEPA
jgi:hypothetical protein